MIQNGSISAQDPAIAGAPITPRRAPGRSLADFRDDCNHTEHGLLPAEEALLEAAAKGLPCLLELACPIKSTDDNCIRSSVLRFLLLGGDDAAPVHEKRLEIHGAYIDGDIDLEGLTTVRSLWLFKCRIAGSLIARDARLETLNLQGSSVRGILCDRARIAGVSLTDGFEADGPVSFAAASIGAGGLTCSNGKFINPGGEALSCRFAKIADSVMLTDGFEAEGMVNFAGAEIDGQFSCYDANIKHRAVAPEQSTWERAIAAWAFNLEDARIGSTLRIGPEKSDGPRVNIKGSLNLQGARCEVFADQPNSWPADFIKVGDGEEIDCVIGLDGFIYNRIAKGTSTDAETRKRWLLRQPPDHLAQGFRSQPFDQLAEVLRQMGQLLDAREICYVKRYCHLRRPKGEHERQNPFNWIWWSIQWLFLEKTLGHGYRPQRMALLALAVMLAFGFVYQKADEQGLFAPTNSLVYRDAELKAACTANGRPAWTSPACPLPHIAPEYTVFNPYIFSLDVIIPLINLRVEEDWQPLRAPFTVGAFGQEFQLPANFLRALFWLETIFAWVWSLSLLVVATSMFRRT
jgi:hypothetical protein